MWILLFPHPLRKTPVHKFYSSVLGQQIQPGGPTKAPPVLSQLPQGFHHLYTHIEYECASPYYHHSGSARRTCLKTGKWSGRHVSCSPGEGSRRPQISDHRTHAPHSDCTHIDRHTHRHTQPANQTDTNVLTQSHVLEFVPVPAFASPLFNPCLPHSVLSSCHLLFGSVWEASDL